MANYDNSKYIEKSIPHTASVPPPPKTEQRSIPQAPNTPPPSKGGSNGKK